MLKDHTVIYLGIIAFGFVSLLIGLASCFTVSGPMPTIFPPSSSAYMECICDTTTDASKNNCRCWGAATDDDAISFGIGAL